MSHKNQELAVKVILEEGTKPTRPLPRPLQGGDNPYKGTKPTPPLPNNGNKNPPPNKNNTPKK